jgi:hypothetical protein
MKEHQVHCLRTERNKQRIKNSKAGMNFLSLNASIFYKRNGGHNKSSNDSNDQSSGLDDLDEMPF